MRLLRLLILITVLAPMTAADDSTAPIIPERSRFRLILLVGQSNMAGRGVVEAEDTVIHPRVLALSQSGTWTFAVDPVHYDKAGAGVGPGRSFGITLAKHDSAISIGLIPAACGGSPISAWVPGGYHAQTKSHPYDDAVKRARIAMKSGELSAILWHQGEADCNPTDAPIYQERLLSLMQRLRTELGAGDVPILIGQLAPFAKPAMTDARQQVDAAHRALTGLLPQVAFVPADGLTSNADQLHIDAASQRRFGQRYAETFLAMTATGGKRSR